MKKKIFKYPVSIHGKTKIHMPFSAKILSIHNQDRKIMLWALVDPKKETDEREFVTVYTGEEVDVFMGRPTFVGTVLLSDGGLVCHIFEIT